MIDMPTDMMTSSSIPYLDLPSPVAGGFQGDAPIEGGGGGGGVDYLVGANRWELASDGRAIQSNGYVLIDYDGDHHYDQAWYADRGGVWRTSTGGGVWTVDGGPVDQLMDLWERGFVL